MSNHFYSSKSAQNSPKAILSTPKTKNFEFSFLSQDCVNFNLIAWESTAKNKWLRSHSSLQAQDSLSTDYFLALLKRKDNNETESELKKLLFGLIKAYERFNASSILLNTINRNNQNLIKLYNKAKKPLVQRKSQETNLIYLRNLAEGKLNSINSLQAELKLKKAELDDLKNQWNYSEIKNLHETKLRYFEAILQLREDQRMKLIEISMIDRATELERNLSSVKSKSRSDALTEKLRNCNAHVLDTIKNIKLLETRKAKIKIHIENLQKAKMNKILSPDYDSIVTHHTKTSNFHLKSSTHFDIIKDKLQSISSKPTTQIKSPTMKLTKQKPFAHKNFNPKAEST